MDGFFHLSKFLLLFTLLFELVVLDALPDCLLDVVQDDGSFLEVDYCKLVNDRTISFAEERGHHLGYGIDSVPVPRLFAHEVSAMPTHVVNREGRLWVVEEKSQYVPCVLRWQQTLKSVCEKHLGAANHAAPTAV